MGIIDISWPIMPTMTEYKDRKTVVFKKLGNDEPYVAESEITFHSHTGTHIDAPSHFIKGDITVDKIPLGSLIGDCVVLDLTYVTDVITREDLERYELEEDAIVLLKTKNSKHPVDAPFDQNFVYLDADAAEYLIDCGVKAVGIDYLGIERNQPQHETHRLLLSNEIAIIEGLRLAAVTEGSAFFICLPIAVVGLDAAPARCVLLDE